MLESRAGRLQLPLCDPGLTRYLWNILVIPRPLPHSLSLKQVDLSIDNVINTHHNDSELIMMMKNEEDKKNSRKSGSRPRLTVTLLPDQRRVLQEIADRNHTSLAHVVRYALDEFVNEARDKQLKLTFPE